MQIDLENGGLEWKICSGPSFSYFGVCKPHTAASSHGIQTVSYILCELVPISEQQANIIIFNSETGT